MTTKEALVAAMMARLDRQLSREMPPSGIPLAPGGAAGGVSGLGGNGMGATRWGSFFGKLFGKQRAKAVKAKSVAITTLQRVQDTQKQVAKYNALLASAKRSRLHAWKIRGFQNKVNAYNKKLARLKLTSKVLKREAVAPKVKKEEILAAAKPVFQKAADVMTKATREAIVTKLRQKRLAKARALPLMSRGAVRTAPEAEMFYQYWEQEFPGTAGAAGAAGTAGASGLQFASDIEEGAAAFGYDVESGGKAFGQDIEYGAAAFGQAFGQAAAGAEAEPYIDW